MNVLPNRKARPQKTGNANSPCGSNPSWPFRICETHGRFRFCRKKRSWRLNPTGILPGMGNWSSLRQRTSTKNGPEASNCHKPVSLVMSRLKCTTNRVNQNPKRPNPDPYPFNPPHKYGRAVNGTRIREGRFGAGLGFTGCLCSKLCCTIV